MKIRLFFLLLVGILVFSCNTLNKKSIGNNQSSCYIDFYKGVLEQPISKAKTTLREKYYVVETEMYEEGESWPALKGCETIGCASPTIIAETSWLDKNLIQRLQILKGSIFIHEDSIRIGMLFYELSKYVSSEIPNAPDGYFFVKDKHCSNVFYQLQSIDKDSTLFYGRVSKLNQVPKNAIIEKIIVNSLNRE